MKKDGNPSFCPDFRKCDTPITRDYYGRICGTKDFTRCHHYSRRHEMLKRPVDWLVSMAIEVELGQ